MWMVETHRQVLVPWKCDSDAPPFCLSSCVCVLLVAPAVVGGVVRPVVCPVQGQVCQRRPGHAPALRLDGRRARPHPGAMQEGLTTPLTQGLCCLMSLAALGTCVLGPHGGLGGGR